MQYSAKRGAVKPPLNGHKFLREIVVLKGRSSEENDITIEQRHSF